MPQTSFVEPSANALPRASHPQFIPRRKSSSAIGSHSLHREESELLGSSALEADSLGGDTSFSNSLIAQSALPAHLLRAMPTGTSPTDSVSSSEFSLSPRYLEFYGITRFSGESNLEPHVNSVSGGHNFPERLNAIEHLRPENRGTYLDELFLKFIHANVSESRRLNVRLMRGFTHADEVHSPTPLLFIDALNKLSAGDAAKMFRSICETYRIHAMDSSTSMGRMAMSKLLLQSTRLDLGADSDELNKLISSFRTTTANHSHANKLFMTLANSLTDLNTPGARAAAVNQMVLHFQRLPINDRIKSIGALLHYFKTHDSVESTSALEMTYKRLSHIQMQTFASHGLQEPEIWLNDSPIQPAASHSDNSQARLYQLFKAMS